MYWLRMQSPLLLGVALLALGCGGSDSTGPSTGSVQVTASTTGADLDPDGYTVAVDGGAGHPLAVNGSVTFSHLDPGNHSVALNGLATNCTVASQNPIVVTVAPGATAQAAFQISCAQQDRIAFSSNRDGGFDIYVMNADGSGVTQVTNNPNTGNPPHDWAPAWSPDGSKIAFQSTRDGVTQQIYVVNADGTGLIQLTSFSGSVSAEVLAWSPDGSSIAFDNFFGGIYVMKADGSNVVQLTPDGSAPAWSPDGTRIAFVSNRDGVSHLFVMSADGSGVTRLTSGSQSDAEPAWSPNASKLAFVSDRDGNGIYVMNSDGSGATRLTNDPGGDHLPDWSPDGKRIAFQRLRAISGYTEVWVINADGSNPAPVWPWSEVAPSYNSAFPTWRP